MINIKPLKAYTDNYIWLLETNEEVSVVDPGDAKPVLDYLRKSKKKLKDILITHHHFDHTAGVPELENIISGSIYGPKFDQMFESLNKLKQLPDSTKIYCGHEYTKSNLLFSVEVEPENNDLIMRNTEIDNLLTEHGSSLPSSIGLEKKTNPFLRCDVLSDNMQLIQKFGLNNPSEKEIFKYIREWKDST